MHECGIMKNRPLFQQDISLLIKKGIIDEKNYFKAYQDANKALERLSKNAEQGKYTFLEAPFFPLDSMQKIIENFQKFHMIVVIGTKHSTVVVKALSALLQSWIWVGESRPRLCFLDQLDPEIFWEIMSVANPHTTGVIVFSQSGETKTTLLQLMRCLEYWHGLISDADLPKHLIIVTSPAENSLKKIAGSFNLQCIDYPENSYNLVCFAAPFLLPVMISGFDAKKFNQGAAVTCAQFFNHHLKSPLEATALMLAAHRVCGVTHHVLFPSSAVFLPILAWMQHAWSEFHCHLSVLLLGETVSQVPHFFTVFLEKNTARERLKPDFWKDIPELNSLARTLLVDQANKEHQIFCEKKITDGHLLRILQVNTLNESTLGALFMNHILEMLLINALHTNSR